MDVISGDRNSQNNADFQLECPSHYCELGIMRVHCSPTIPLQCCQSELPSLFYSDKATTRSERETHTKCLHVCGFGKNHPRMPGLVQIV